MVASATRSSLGEIPFAESLILAKPPKIPMARKPARRKFRRYLRGAIDHQLSLGTLSANTLIGSLVNDTVDDSTWISSVRATWSLDDLTPAADDGPILVGIAQGPYTDAQVEEWIENTGAWKAGSPVAQEIARRRIRQVGTFEGAASATLAQVLNDGKEITTKCGWMMAPGEAIRIWAYNTGGSALATTDPNVRVQGHANLWPK